MTPENQVKKAVLDGFAWMKIPAYRLNSGAQVSEYKGKKRFFRYGFTGCPDIIALLTGGRALWVECKSAKGRLSPDQIAFQELCKELGHAYIVARSWDDVLGWMRQDRTTALRVEIIQER